MESDWDTLTILKKRHNNKEDKSRAMRNGDTETVLKKKGGADGAMNYKLDNESEAQVIQKIPKEIASKIRQARNNMGLTQKQLAGRLSIKSTSINEIENGTAKLKGNKDYIKVKNFLKVK